MRPPSHAKFFVSEHLIFDYNKMIAQFHIRYEFYYAACRIDLLSRDFDYNRIIYSTQWYFDIWARDTRIPWKTDLINNNNNNTKRQIFAHEFIIGASKIIAAYHWAAKIVCFVIR